MKPKAFFVVMLLWTISFSAYAASSVNQLAEEANSNRKKLCEQNEGCVLLETDENVCVGEKGMRNEYPRVDSETTFEAFARTFYCDLKLNRAEKYLERIEFPLPYVSYSTEGERKGVFEKTSFTAWMISAGDGYELKPLLSVNGSYGRLSVEWFGTGMVRTWNFALKKGGWTLVSVELGDY